MKPRKQRAGEPPLLGPDGFTIDTSMSGTLANNTLPTATTVAVNQPTGGGGAHNNLPPFHASHIWKRTA